MREGTGRQLLHVHREPAWLPPGARAEVVGVDGACEPPAPVGIVRLLLRDDGGGVLVVRRPDGDGWDIPSAAASGLDPLEVLAGLAATYGARDPRLLGFVRNVVDGPADDYPWPVPLAHFCVWTARGAEPTPGARWLTPAEAAVELGERHWWPLLGRPGDD